jgi:hypothetical protein
MSTEHIQNNIDAPSQIIQLNQQAEKQKYLLQAIIKSDTQEIHGGSDAVGSE